MANIDDQNNYIEDAEFHNSFLDGNEMIESAISQFYSENSEENLIGILESDSRAGRINFSLTVIIVHHLPSL